MGLHVRCISNREDELAVHPVHERLLHLSNHNVSLDITPSSRTSRSAIAYFGGVQARFYGSKQMNCVLLGCGWYPASDSFRLYQLHHCTAIPPFHGYVVVNERAHASFFVEQVTPT